MRSSEHVRGNNLGECFAITSQLNVVCTNEASIHESLIVVVTLKLQKPGLGVLVISISRGCVVSLVEIHTLNLFSSSS
jgi:hypothetical protein